MKQKNRITLICNRNYSVKKFRKNLIEALKKDHSVSLIIIENSDEKITIEDVDIFYISDNNRDINPLNKIHLKNKIVKLLRKIEPKTVFTFQITPNIFGVLAAKECGIKEIYSMIEGVGDVFINKGIFWETIRTITIYLYKKSIRNCKKVFFICEDDKNEFIEKKLVEDYQSVVINGVGVDIEYFKYKEIRNTNTFIMIARMSITKGVFEYCKAAEMVKKKYPETTFILIGEEFTLNRKDIKRYIDANIIEYLGYKEDVRPYIENSFVNILPSYREGFGLVIAEAGSIGRASIVSNTQGCKDAIIENKTGILFKNRNHKKLAEKIMFALENKEKFIEMGKNASSLAKEKFNQEIINAKIIKELQ